MASQDSLPISAWPMTRACKGARETAGVMAMILPTTRAAWQCDTGCYWPSSIHLQLVDQRRQVPDLSSGTWRVCRCESTLKPRNFAFWGGLSPQREAQGSMKAQRRAAPSEQAAARQSSMRYARSQPAACSGLCTSCFRSVYTQHACRGESEGHSSEVVQIVV